MRKGGPIPHKRGDTFEYAGPVTITGVATLDGWQVASQARHIDTGALVQQFDAVIASAADRVIRIVATAAQTAAWPIAKLHWDIQFTDPAGRVISTQTEIIEVVADVTRPA